MRGRITAKKPMIGVFDKVVSSFVVDKHRDDDDDDDRQWTECHKVMETYVRIGPIKDTISYQHTRTYPYLRSFLHQFRPITTSTK